MDRDWKLGLLHHMAHACDMVTTGRSGAGGRVPEIHLLDDILLMGCKGPDCGTHCPFGVTSSRMSALTLEFWRFPVSGEKQL